ncbi:SUMO-specific isopeptidase USPL1 isoform X2 [Pagrus major]|uniref:SUMO-specific isopeptidase USPL1 isoform X2 n=1 Tax=Pagrus major TaxID=143350 RepID=UPI003CC87A72
MLYICKVQERAASLENCPWCTSKGLTYALRSYRINLQESITLCTNPQCLFPLVSRSLEDVLASLDPVQPTIGTKRKNASALEKEESIKPARKRLRSSEVDSLGLQCTTDTLISQADPGAVNIVSNGQHAGPKTDGEKVNGYQKDSPVAETTGWDLSQDEDYILDKEPENAACTDGSALPSHSVADGHPQCSNGGEPVLSPHRGSVGKSAVVDDLRCCSLDSGLSLLTKDDIRSAEVDTPSPQHNDHTARMGQKSDAADVTTCMGILGIKSQTENLSCSTKTESEDLVPVSNQLFWRNSNNLCWLDSLLVALVNCKTLKKCKPNDEPQRSSVWQLMRGYEDVCATIQAHQQPAKDGVVGVPNHVLQKANADLQSLRMSVFKLLQPKLHCKLGQRETPVFALPLLLTMDSWVEPLFQSTFQWVFKCRECKAGSEERKMKTLPTFTNISPDWRPLHAVHSAPCNLCCKKNQRRTMMLERLPPVFMLHFVEGLPDNDVRIYTFTFKGKRYSVTTVIQYNQQLKHFVTWIRNSDGSWLEYDDLKHPDCKTHQILPVPAEQIHVVFWEVEEDKEPPACSPSSTFVESPPPKNTMNPSPSDSIVDEPCDGTPDHSTLMSHNDTDIVCALSASEDGSNIIDTTVTAGVDTSIGSTTLLDTFEGLTHNDIITLTLVEVTVDSEMHPGPPQDLSAPSRSEIIDSTPDSSSTVTGVKESHGPNVEPPTTSNSSESDNDSSSDPTIVPGGRGRGRGVGRGKTVARQTGKKAASTKAAPDISPPASSESSKEISNKPAPGAAQDATPRVETTQQVSPVSSTDTLLLPTSQENPIMQPVSLQSSRWSFLLGKHPLNPVHKPTDKPIPTLATQVKPTLPSHSTPNPVRRQQISGGLFPKPPLKTEESEGLPLKAAEMYDAFGAKSSNTQGPLLASPALISGNSKLSQPITSKQNTVVVSGTSLLMPRAKGLPEISSSNKCSSQLSKVPPSVSATEALRYKLMKKLKAKKKRLDKLNKMLGQQGGASLRPDSTDLDSPNTVTSSTYDSSICDDFFSDLLSPATTASNLSPDSTGFLEMLASGQDGGDQLDGAAGAVLQVNTCPNEPHNENFLEDFLLQAVAERPSEMETEALSELLI